MSVYTTITEDELSQFLTRYDLGTLRSFEGISEGIENTNYFVDTEAGRYVLTIFEQHSFDELPYFLNIMAFMAEHAIPTAHPIADREGNYLNRLHDKPAALVQRLDGCGVEQPNVRQCAVMGETLARFHLAGRDFDGYRANDRDLSWAERTFAEIEPYLDEEDKALLRDELAYQQAQDWAHLPQGVIHADLFTDNALFRGDELAGIIDLYYACNAPWLYDLAVMVNDWARDEENRYDLERVRAIMQAYQQVRPLTELEQAEWPAAQRMAALRFWLSRLKDKVLPREGALTMIKNPDVFRQVLLHHRTEPLPHFA
ncbi:homoserine kinase [Sulfurivirga caldicuralii]|uniref:Homoserine kinase n=1 Tax=Sulfurivirga caldicuralii TaxID=364032 RepID=A0A1N6HAA3_9GAMM|nr:homoserine kinase [Sulfurivirga caldicuralii]SIO16768.1 homoserine kinase [Sulfurivirga caldicuralii]